MSSLILSAASGGIFGAALTASGVYSPSVIKQQLQLTNWHMLETFMTASACSALIVVAARRSQYAQLASRSDSSYGWFMKYDANIIGGALQGIAMAFTGACPGTVLVQAALGYKTARNMLIGCLLGGIAYVKLGPQLRRNQNKTTDAQNSLQTVQEKFGLSTASTIPTYETLCLTMVVAASLLAPTRDHWLNPIIGGVLIGVAQATSVLFTRKTLSVSSAWEDVGKAFWKALDGTPGPTAASCVFATGIMAGAKLISQHVPTPSEGYVSTVSPATAVLGGFLSIFGARIAVGCTSGHGISGMATMSISSFITVASMFGGGIAAGLAMK